MTYVAGINDLIHNRWPEDEELKQIEYWRKSYAEDEDMERLAAFNAWVKAEGLEDVEAEPSTYYNFPGGVQVRDISAHLTSFGGQALQYVARATRLDGNNKGEAVKDLQKAIDFIGWEIERLEAGNA